MAATSRLLGAARIHLMLYGTRRSTLAALSPHVRIATIGAMTQSRTIRSVVLCRLVHDDKTVATVLDDLQYHKLADETLEELGQFFEDLGDTGLCPSDYDVALANGVLTINVGGKFGTYVINKQSPNRQIWLSSPKSGPKRYDVIKGRWRYSHDGSALHDLLSNEFSELLDSLVDLSDLKYSHIINNVHAVLEHYGYACSTSMEVFNMCSGMKPFVTVTWDGAITSCS